MKKSKYPKKQLTKLPEGFEYSDEAKQSFKERAELADKELQRRCAKDPALKKRVDELLSIEIDNEELEANY